MGLGPSYEPLCRSKCCEKKEKVEYVYKTNKYKYPFLPKKLDPWWIQSSYYDNVSLFWACKTCYHLIPNQYKKYFVYKQTYIVHGM